MRNRQPKRSANTIRAVFELVPFQIFHIKTMQNSDNSNEKPIQNPYAVEKEYNVDEEADQGPPGKKITLLQIVAWVLLILISPVAGGGAFFFTCLGGVGFSDLAGGGLNTIGGLNVLFLLSSAAGLLAFIGTLFYGGKAISKFK